MATFIPIEDPMRNSKAEETYEVFLRPRGSGGFYLLSRDSTGKCETIMTFYSDGTFYRPVTRLPKQVVSADCDYLVNGFLFHNGKVREICNGEK